MIIDYFTEHSWQQATFENYRHLALAVILSAIKERDVGFLASGWCDELLRLCALPFTGRELLRQAIRTGAWRMSWKQNERTIAKRLQGQRVGNTGKATPDVVSDWLSVEVKERKRLPDWILEGMAQAVRNAKPGTLPVMVLHQVGQRYDKAIVCVRLTAFTEWFGEIARSSDTCESEFRGLEAVLVRQNGTKCDI